MEPQPAPRTPGRILARGLVDERWIPLTGHLVLLGLVTILVRGAAPSRVIAVWATTILVLVAARGLWSIHARDGTASEAAIVLATRIAMTALGLAWGVGTVVVGQYVPFATSSIIVMALAGLLAGAINTLVADRWAFPLYAVSLFGPTLAASALLRLGNLGAIADVLIAVFVAFMIIQHRRAHDNLVQRLWVEDELRNRERQLASAQAIAHIGSWELDMIANRVTWSDEAYRLWGVPLGSPVDYNVFVAGLHPDDRARVEQLVAEGLAQRRNIEYECRIVRPNGEVRHLFNRNIVVTNGGGQPIRLAGTCLDITERKLAEENRQTLLRELQTSVAEVKILQGILPICASCKRIRNDGGEWEPVESYVRDRTNAEFSHGLCPDCVKKDWS